jgi:hypothetical protein
MAESKDVVFPMRYVSLSAAAAAWSGSTDMNSASTPCHAAAKRSPPSSSIVRSAHRRPNLPQSLSAFSNRQMCNRDVSPLSRPHIAFAASPRASSPLGIAARLPGRLFENHVMGGEEWEQPRDPYTQPRWSLQLRKCAVPRRVAGARCTRSRVIATNSTTSFH